MNFQALKAIGLSTTALLIAQCPLAYAQAAPAGAPDAGVSSGPVVTDLRSALASAYSGDPSLLSARADVRSVDQQAAQARAQYGPNLTAQTTYGYNKLRQDFFTVPSLNRQKGWTGTASLILTQPLLTSGRLKAGVLAADATVAFQNQSLRFSEAQTLLNAITAYVNVRRDKALFDIATDNFQLLDRQYNESNERFQVREITKTDLDQVITRVEQGRASVAQARGTLNASKGQFLNDVGAQPGQLQALPDLPNVPTTLDGAYAIAEGNSPLVKAAQAREKISRARVEGAKAQFGPNVALRGEYSYGDTGISVFQNTVKQEVWRGEVTATLPIYSSGGDWAALNAARQANESDWRLIDQSVRDLRSQVNAVWNQLVASRLAISHLEISVVAAQRAYDGAVVQLRAGARTTLDVLDLARDLLNVRASLVTARADEYTARAQLLAAMGRLEVADIYPEIDRYDPSLYHNRAISSAQIMSLGVGTVVETVESVAVGGISKPRASRDGATRLDDDGDGAPLGPTPSNGP